MATLYRKYRSKRFEDVIGQDPIITTLTNQIKLGRIGHAYLFTGSRGVGKTSCARIFARAVNCMHPVNGSPCGECEVCKKLESDNVDIIEMDAASNNGVDDARDIREKVKYLPVACKYKVYIIDEVHMLTGGAFNALLKTIEEPPEHVIFILATTEPQKLPQTILSRCIRFDFKLVPTDILAKHVAHVYDLEGIKYTPDAVEEIARLGEGSVRDALSVADTLASAAEEITSDIVLKLTGAGETEAISELFCRIAEKDLSGVLNCVDMLASSGRSMSAVCRQLIDYTRNVLVAKSVGRANAFNGIINANRAALEKICDTAEKYDMRDIAYMLEELGAAENGLKYSVAPRVFIETALVKLVCGARRNDDILKRLDALESNSDGIPSEQKKNKVIAPAESAPDRIEPRTQSGSRVEVKSPHGNGMAREDDYIPPPPDEFIPPPAEMNFSPPPSVPNNRTVVSSVKATSADEGEFRHLSAQTMSGLELLGKIAGALRRSADRRAGRVRQLLARGVVAKERDDAIGFVAPDEAFLQMSEPDVIAVLNDTLDAIGIVKRARIERTDDDLRQEDIARAKDLFGRDGVIIE